MNGREDQMELIAIKKDQITQLSEQLSEQTWLGAREVAAILGVSEPHVYRMAKTNKIPCLHFGAAWRFPKAEIEAWLRQETRVAGKIAAPPPAQFDPWVEIMFKAPKSTKDRLMEHCRNNNISSGRLLCEIVTDFFGRNGNGHA